MVKLLSLRKRKAFTNPLDIFYIASSFPQAQGFPLSTNSSAEWIMTGHKTVRICQRSPSAPRSICTTVGSPKHRLQLRLQYVLQVTSDDHLRIDSCGWTSYPIHLHRRLHSSTHSSYTAHESTANHIASKFL